MSKVRKNLIHWSTQERKDFIKYNMTPIVGRFGFFKAARNFKAWKFTKTFDNSGFVTSNVIVELLIPIGSNIFIGEYHNDNTSVLWGSGDRKMRADKALVVRQYEARDWKDSEPSYIFVNEHTLYGAVVDGPEIQKSQSEHDPTFSYVTGMCVHPTEPFSLSHDQCTSGIHFFIEQSDAIEYSGG